MSASTISSINEPVVKCNNREYGCVGFEQNLLLIERLKKENELLLNRNSALIDANALLSERLLSMLDDFKNFKYDMEFYSKLTMELKQELTG